MIMINILRMVSGCIKLSARGVNGLLSIFGKQDGLYEPSVRHLDRSVTGGIWAAEELIPQGYSRQDSRPHPAGLCRGHYSRSL
jgi:hypothetical protein